MERNSSQKNFFFGKKMGLFYILSAYILLIFMLAFSFSQLIKNIKFISSSDKVVRILSNIVSEQKEMNIVYLDQVLPKNLQSIHFNKNFYYSEIDKIPYFLKISKIDPENLLFVSSTHSNKCFLNGKLCEDRPSIMNLHFYKISN